MGPYILDPVVCGQEGYEFANPCLAEAAGYHVDTQCYREGPGPGPAGCDKVYAPVSCGGDEFNNFCLAQRVGFYPDQCTSIDRPVVVDPCEDVFEPVSCGRYDFDNFCLAEREGYSPKECISIIDPDDGCPYTYLPVLCEGYYEYDNLCLAENAGYPAYDCVDVGGGGGGDGCTNVYDPVCCGSSYDSFNDFSNLCRAERAGFDPQDCTAGVCGGGGSHNPDGPVVQGCPGYCSAPFAEGECYGVAQAWGYNSQTQRCEQFTYGGCAGNRNNFDTPQQCRNACFGCNTYSF